MAVQIAISARRLLIATTVLLSSVVFYSSTAHASQPSWTTNLVTTDGVTMTDVTCTADTSTCLAAGMHTTSTLPLLYRSTDQGNSWSFVPTAPAPVSRPDWSDMYVPGQSGPITSLTCPSSTWCVALEGDAVISSQDAGATWNFDVSLGSEESGQEMSLACPTDLVCYVSSRDGDDVMTTDGGVTWTNLGFGQGGTFGTGGDIFPGALSCPVVGTCYQTGLNGYHAWVESGVRRLSMRVYRTNGIAVTSVASALSVPASESAGFGGEIAFYGGGLQCPGLNTCYLSDGSSTGSFLDKSEDGGATWSATTSMAPQSIAGWMTCPTTTTCAAVTTDPTRPGQLLMDTTADSGSTWHSLVMGSDSGPSYYGNLYCATTSFCMATGMGLPAGVIATLNGGTWRSVSTPVGHTALTHIACPTSTHCVAIGLNDAFVSNDGGVTWTPSAAPITSLNSQVFSLSCFSALRCMMTGANLPRNGFGRGEPTYRTGVIAVTSDGGMTWRPASSSPRTEPLGEVKCSSIGNCLLTTFENFGIDRPGITYPTVVYRSTDFGSTWTSATLPLPPLNRSISAMVCPSRAICYALSWAAPKSSPYLLAQHVLKSADGGRTWRSLVLGQFQRAVLDSIDCVSISTCVIVGAKYVPYDYRDDVVRSYAIKMSLGGAVFRGFSTPMSNHWNIPLTPPQISTRGSTWRILDNFDSELGTIEVETSHDAGVTWHPERPFPANSIMSSMASSSAHTIIVGQTIRGGALILTLP